MHSPATGNGRHATHILEEDKHGSNFMLLFVLLKYSV